MPDIHWNIHLHSPPEKVFGFLTTDRGRSKFWAEKTTELNGYITFEFVNGWTYKSKIIQQDPPEKFELIYFDSLVTFKLKSGQENSTDLALFAKKIREAEYPMINAGWVSVLLALKAAADFGVDLRNHDPGRCWDQSFADN